MGGGQFHYGETAEEPDGNIYVKVIRIANVLVSAFLAFAGVWAFISGEANSVTNIFAAIYTIGFGLLLLVHELRLPMFKEKVKRNFGFMSKSWGKAIYMLFIGFMPLSLDPNIGRAAGILMLAVAVTNFIVLCKFGTKSEAYNSMGAGHHA